MGASKFDFEGTKMRLNAVAGYVVNVQQVSPLRMRSMVRWPALMLHEYEERAAVFEYVGNALRVAANNDAFDHVNAMITRSARPSVAKVCPELQERLLRFFARAPRLSPLSQDYFV